jgi:uncharacterized membrane protein YfcA
MRMSPLVSFFGHIDPIFVFSGFCVGFLVGMTGIGGGSLMTPLLILLFGVQPATAVGTDLLFAASTKTVGTLVHGVAKTIDWRLVGLLATGSVPATVATVVVLATLEASGTKLPHLVTFTLAGVLLLTSSFLLCTNSIRVNHADRIGRLSQGSVGLFTVVLGAAMGVLVTLTSVGAGAIGVTVLLLLHPKTPIARIVGSDIAHAVPLTLLAGIGHWFLGEVDWRLLVTLLIGSMPGIVVGSHMVGKFPEGVVRAALALVLLAVAIRLIV